MERTKLRILLFLLFIGGLIIIPQKAKANEVEVVPVNISLKYGQTEARTILDMINEARTNPAYAWYWDKTDTNRIACPGLEELQYDYDLERVAMKRAAEIALSYAHERPIGGYVWDIYEEENIEYRAVGENIAVAQKTASDVNFAWREDNEKYGGQGHRRNMLSYNYNCVGIGHVYYNNCNYWVEVFANRPEINTTEVPANDSTQTVSVSVDKTKIEKIEVTFDQDSYSLRIGESTTPAIKETRIYVTDFRSYGRGLAPVLDTPVISVDDSSVTSYSNNKLSGLKEGTTNLTATLYGVTSSTSPLISVHDCKNHWDAGSITKQPTCTDTGEKTFTCSICRKTTKKESVPATGHAYASTWTTDIAATCEKAGTESRHCQNENCKVTIEQRSIVALGHDWKDNGNETATCMRNGCTAIHTHEWDSGEITKTPTCIKKGVLTKHCTEVNCTQTNSQSIPATGHQWDNGKITTEATCTKDGVTTITCTACGKTTTTPITAKGHEWDNGKITTPASCTEKGIFTYTCNVCKITNPTDIEAIGHSYKVTAHKPAACITDGYTISVCRNCSDEQKETIPATGHQHTDIRDKKPATCSEMGYTGDLYCTDCGNTISLGKNIDKTNHNYIQEQYQKATCTENGYEISVCQFCNDVKRKNFSATGHVKRTLNKKKATCKAKGYSGDIYCRLCDALLEKGTILPQLEHQWNDGRITRSATYETAGECTYHCRKCGTKKTVSIKKLAYPKAGTLYTISGNQYKVLKPGAEVILIKTSNTTKNVTVPAQINVQRIIYKVTSIEAKAFNNNKNLTKVTIGTNVAKINNNAFFNCKNLKTVTIKSVLLTTKTASQKAFKNAHKKLVIQVPKKVKKNYTKIFKGLKVK